MKLNFRCKPDGTLLAAQWIMRDRFLALALVATTAGISISAQAQVPERMEIPRVERTQPAEPPLYVPEGYRLERQARAMPLVVGLALLGGTYLVPSVVGAVNLIGNGPGDAGLLMIPYAGPLTFASSGGQFGREEDEDWEAYAVAVLLTAGQIVGTVFALIGASGREVLVPVESEPFARFFFLPTSEGAEGGLTGRF